MQKSVQTSPLANTMSLVSRLEESFKLISWINVEAMQLKTSQPLFLELNIPIKLIDFSSK